MEIHLNASTLIVSAGMATLTLLFGCFLLLKRRQMAGNRP